VAIVGASERRPDIVQTAQAGTARTWLVNPGRDAVLGQRSYPSIGDLPEVPDVAMIVTGHRSVEQAVREAIAAGVRGLVIPGLGAEAGTAGRAIAMQIAALAAEAQVPVLGANCMGYARPGGTSLYMSGLPRSVVAGRVAVISQSGSVAEALLAVGPRVGYRVVVSTGSELARDTADFAAAFAADEQSQVIGLFLETIRRPSALSAALRACADVGKPVVCTRVGRSSLAAEVALSHTGAMVGRSAAVSAFLAAHGVIEVTDIHELIDTMDVLGRPRRPPGVRVAAVSESGGEAGLLADHAQAAGLRLEPLPKATATALQREFPNFVEPHNPLDAWAVDDVDRVFPRSLQLLRDAASYDILIAQLELTRFRSAPDNAWCARIVRALAAAAQGAGVFPAVISGCNVDPPDEIAQFAWEAGVALLRGTRAATAALAAAARWRPRHPAMPPPAAMVDVSDLLRPGVLPEFESATLFTRYGVQFAPCRRARSGAEAAQAAAELGWPVVVKLDGPAHKASRGGVILGVTTTEQAAAAAHQLGGTVLVATQVQAGPEIICGALRDPVFGPVITIGLGGALAEPLGITAAALAPLGPANAAELIDTLPGLTAVASERARAQLAAIFVGLSRAVTDHPQIISADINPVVLGPQGAMAVDALIVVAPAGPAPIPSGHKPGTEKHRSDPR
jgi:acetyltransferase